jgi:hypothetical protein
LPTACSLSVVVLTRFAAVTMLLLLMVRLLLLILLLGRNAREVTAGFRFSLAVPLNERLFSRKDDAPLVLLLNASNGRRMILYQHHSPPRRMRFHSTARHGTKLIFRALSLALNVRLMSNV